MKSRLDTWAVYVIKNCVNNKCYVGQTRYALDSYFRWNMTAAISGKTAKTALYRAIRKYGVHSFSIHPLVVKLATKEKADFWERKLIAMFKSQNPQVGYNLCAGGEGVSGLNEAQRKAISDRKKGVRPGGNNYRHSPEVLARIRLKVLGQKRNFIPWNKGLTKHDDPRIKASTTSFKLGHRREKN